MFQTMLFSTKPLDLTETNFPPFSRVAIKSAILLVRLKTYSLARERLTKVMTRGIVANEISSSLKELVKFNSALNEFKFLMKNAGKN